MKVKTALTLAALVAAAVAAWVVWKGGKKLVTETLNPASDKNIAYSGVNAIGAAVSGNENFSLGSAIYGILHPFGPDDFDEAQARKTCAVLYPPGGAKRPASGSLCARLGY